MGNSVCQLISYHARQSQTRRSSPPHRRGHCMGSWGHVYCWGTLVCKLGHKTCTPGHSHTAGLWGRKEHITHDAECRWRSSLNIMPVSCTYGRVPGTSSGYRSHGGYIPQHKQRWQYTGTHSPRQSHSCNTTLSQRTYCDIPPELQHSTESKDTLKVPVKVTAVTQHLVKGHTLPERW